MTTTEVHSYEKSLASQLVESHDELEADKRNSTSGEVSSDSSETTDKLGCLFFKLAGDDEGINAFELQILMGLMFKENLTNAEDFSLEACRSMVSMADKDRSGILGFSEFKSLWFQVLEWKDMFDANDEDNNRKVSYKELYEAIQKMGINLKPETVKVIMRRFQGKTGSVNLDDFMQICCKINTAKTSYENLCDDAPPGKFMMDIIYS